MTNTPLTKEKLIELLARGYNIAVIGNIGAGKTTLCKELGKRLGAKVHYESVEDNPYLELFYAEPEKYVYLLQKHFLDYSMNQVLAMRNEPLTLHIQDRCPHEGPKVFVPVLRNEGVMTDADYSKFITYYQFVLKNTDKDKFIYIWLDVPPEICYERVQIRGRDCEKELSLDYLKKLDSQYQQFFSAYFIKAPYIHIKVDMPMEEILEQMYIDAFLDAR